MLPDRQLYCHRGSTNLERFGRALATSDPQRILQQIETRFAPRRLPDESELLELKRTLLRTTRQDPRIAKRNVLEGLSLQRPAKRPGQPGSRAVEGDLARRLVADAHRTRRAPPVVRDSVARPTASPGLSLTGSFFSGIDAGAFQMDFDGPWPAMDAASKRDTLAFVWDPYYGSSSRLSYEDIHGMIREWRADDDPDGYFFWNDGWGGAHRTFLHAVRLLDVYRGYIINGGENCPNAGTLFSNHIVGEGYKLKVDNANDCLDVPAVITYDSTHHNFPTAIDVSGARGYFNRANNTVHVCQNQMSGYGRVVDLLLFWAHMGRGFAASTGDLITGIYYLGQAQRLGRLALGATSFIARTLLHEMMHYHFRPGPCEWGCCMQRSSLRWQCRVFSALGLYVADEASGIDIELIGNDLEYYSGCRPETDEVPAASFEGTCTMLDPGTQGDPEAWTGREDWTNPAGCP